MPHRTLIIPLFAALLAPAAALADHDKDESGKGRERRWEHKEEIRQGNCKIERKWEKNGDYKEERKCKGGPDHGHRHVRAAPAPVAVVYPPWIVVQQGEPVYAPQYEPRPVAGNASRCNSDTVGRVLGGVVGGALGNQVGKGSGRAVATIGGAVAGVLIGGEIGRRMDANDQACVGQVLEVAPVNHRVQWMEGPAQYAVVPGAVVSRQGTHCRPYTLEVRADHGGVQRSQGTACRRADGVWVAG